MPILGAYIVPHPPVIVSEVGQGKEKEIQKTIDAYEEVAKRIAKSDPETIIVITPHAILYSDYIHISPGVGSNGSLRKFGAPSVSVQAPYDIDLVSAISFAASEAGIPAGTMGEKDNTLDHGTLVPLYFINHHLKHYNLVRIAISGLSREEHYNFGICLKNAVDEIGRSVVIVASGDLSHKLSSDGPYTYAEEGPIFDREITRAMEEADFLKFLNIEEELYNAAGECGLNSFIIMAGALDKTSVEADLLSYEGPFGVGYAVCAYKVLGQDPSRDFGVQSKTSLSDHLVKIKENEDPYVKLARQALETYVLSGKTMELPKNTPTELLEKRAGTFVTIKKNGRLRGCIGTIGPTEPTIAEEIIRNAISSAASDFRFPQVAKEELAQLVYSVDVLSTPEPVQNRGQLDVKRYGVIATSGRKRGLLLPNLENVSTVDEQISIALQKGGISPDAAYNLERFEVVRHH